MLAAFARAQAPERADAAPDSVAEAAQPAQGSPRATVRTFFESMQAFRSGNELRLLDAVNCLYLGDGLTDDVRVNRGASPAQTIYAVMEQVQFDLGAIPEAPQGDDYTLRLGADDEAPTLYLHRYEDDGLWRFSSRTLDPAHLDRLAAHAAERASASEPETAQFVPRFRSPRATLEVFIKGMRGEDGYTRADAIATLDLSAVNPVDRPAVGESKASDLLAVIERTRPVILAEIPPDSSGETYVYFQDPLGAGSIVLAPLPDLEQPELRAWRFTKGTLDRLEALYLNYRDQPLLAGAGAASAQRPWANRIRDWIHQYNPALMESPLYLRNYQWLGLLLLVGLGVLVSRMLTLLVGVFLRYWFRRKGYAYDRRLEREFILPIRISLMAWVWLLGLTLLGLNPAVLQYLRVAAFFVTAAGAVWASYRLVDIVGRYLSQRAQATPSKYDDLVVPIVVRTLKIFIIVAGIVAFAYQFTTDPAGLITGLGLGGLAFALAAKDVVANVFGSITILMDRPFRIGDWVTIGTIDGTVEEVGIRSTRIRTFYNSLITVPNSAITNTHIDNMGRRRYRRIKTTLAIAYDTPPDAIEAFCEGIRELIRQHPYTRKDYYHVYLNDFGASSLDILLYCFVETPEWGTELRERHRLLLDIVRLAAELGVEFAFPTRTLYMREDAAPQRDFPREERAASGAETGQRAARGILRRHGGPPGVIPPPVSYEHPEFNARPQHGEDDDE